MPNHEPSFPPEPQPTSPTLPHRTDAEPEPTLLELFEAFTCILDDVDEDPKDDTVDWVNRLGWAWDALDKFAAKMGPDYQKAVRPHYRTNEHVFVESQGDWASDLSLNLARQLEAITCYLGVEFPDGWLWGLAFEATRRASEQMLDEFRAGKARAVEPAGERPGFCFWTPNRTVVEES